jgi:hypothetical protein
MGYKPTIPSHSKPTGSAEAREKRMKERASETKKRDDEKAAAMKAAAMNEAKGAGYAKGGMVKAKAKPRGWGKARRPNKCK